MVANMSMMCFCLCCCNLLLLYVQLNRDQYRQSFCGFPSYNIGVVQFDCFQAPEAKYVECSGSWVA